MAKKLENYYLCKSAFSKAKGLMFSSKKTLVFDLGKEKKVNLHMMFVFFPINVYFLDKEKKVVEVKENFLPFTFYNSKEKASFVIENPEKLDVKVGEAVEW